MNIKTVRVLPIEEMFFIKKINLEDTFSSGVICYARKLSDVYRLRPNKSSIEGNLYLGYKEEEYPSDILDQKIFDTVKETFHHLIVNTSLMMLDDEREFNVRWANQYRKETLQIIIEYVDTYGISRIAPIKKEIEVLYMPSLGERQMKMNTNVNIITSDREEYKLLCSLLSESYRSFSEVCGN